MREGKTKERKEGRKDESKEKKIQRRIKNGIYWVGKIALS